MKVSKKSFIYLIIISIILVILILNIIRYFDKIEEFTTDVYVNNNKLNGKYGTTCQKCRTCPTGNYLKDCGELNEGSCTSCEGYNCPPGQRHTGCGGTSNGNCTQNVCTCENGYEATGASCNKDGLNKCRSCDDGYEIKGNECKPFIYVYDWGSWRIGNDWGTKGTVIGDVPNFSPNNDITSIYNPHLHWFSAYDGANYSGRCFDGNQSHYNNLNNEFWGDRSDDINDAISSLKIGKQCYK